MKEGDHVASELTEKDLLENGFTVRNVSRLREVLNRNENAGETLSGLVDDLSRRFYAGVLCLLLVLAPLIFLPVFYPPSLLLYYLPVAIFGVIAVWYLIPLGLSWKAYRMMKGR
ncbi:hypothetical protein ACVS9S_003236 [Cronobacter dublinensis]|uniref:hypothetical protein n=1 Tax=Enterobacteriaceae TaxID=543 RepID=UPI0024AED8CC|nr:MULTISPECIES: hypothetical protein [Enterobacteriaceae]MDI7390719.1 hypothetical protein [Cronobacter dublinensis]MDZ7324944.1 hypothetical protein [Kosakonia sacchari]